MIKQLVQYLYELKLAKAILWCYLIWYVVIVYFYLDPSLKLWLSSIGISLVIGTGLLLSVAPSKASKKDHWQTFRLYLMPFCVSSFSALTKGQGFIIFVSPKVKENLVALSICVLFILIVSLVKFIKNKTV